MPRRQTASVSSMPGLSDVLAGPGLVFRPERQLVKALCALLLFAAYSILGVLSRPWLGEGYASLIFVLGITAIGAVCGLWWGVSAAVGGALVFNLLVAEPTFELNFNRSTDIAPVAVFLLCAVISGFMAGRLRDESQRARRGSRLLERLFLASHALQSASREADLATALCEGIGRTATRGVWILRWSHGNVLPLTDEPVPEEALAVARQAARDGEKVHVAGLFKGCPLHGRSGLAGVLVIEAADEGLIDAGFVQALAPVVTLALERTLLASYLAEVSAARRAEDLKSALLSSVSHDLRSPLTAISASASTLLEFGDKVDAQTAQELLHGIVDEAERLNQLTTNLLQMTRLLGVDGRLPGSVLPAAEMIRNVKRRQARFAGDRKLLFEPPALEVQVLADTALFELVLTNVVQNAIRYSPDGSTVTLACRADGGACEIRVADEGPGIPPGEQTRVFERFYRLERDERMQRGSGLGLAIARGFVEASGGSIAIVSPVADGRGTCIVIRLPLA